MRVAFNGSGIAKNNRMLERHDAVHGYYWRTYDFEEVPQNLADRGLQAARPAQCVRLPARARQRREHVPARRRRGDLQPAERAARLLIMNAVNNRLDKAPTAIVTDPKRPDKAVETGHLVHGLPHPRHPPEGRPDARPPDARTRRRSRRPTPTWSLALYPREGEVAGPDGGGRQEVPDGVAQTGHAGDAVRADHAP